MIDDERVQWWSELRQSGMLLSPAVLPEYLPDTLPEISNDKYMRLRDAYLKFQSWVDGTSKKDTTPLYQWIEAVLISFLDHDQRSWQKGSLVSEIFKVQSITKEKLRPNWVYLWTGRESEPRFLMKIDTTSKHVGMGRGRHEYGKFVELLRGTGVSTGIITNGLQFRLVYAGLDYDCWVEWEVERWFEDALGMTQLVGFSLACGPWATDHRDDIKFPLHKAIQESRSRQGELSQVLGEQTRTAVEELLKALDTSIRSDRALLDSLKIDPSSGREISESEMLDALYQSAIRIIMRMVVVFFAEARELLPKSNDIYHTSYGVEGLYAQLNAAIHSESEMTLEGHHHAWPRLLSLFRLIHEGSSYPELPIHAYGGQLFKRADAQSPDAIMRALCIYENKNTHISDATVYHILKLLKIGKVRAKIGRTSRMVSGPVDFSGLRTEYIGMMYEGLLDYHLRKVSEEQQAVVFLNIGQQPALPFSLLKSLDESNLKDLLNKLSKEKSEGLKVDDEGEDDEEIDEGAPEESDQDIKDEKWSEEGDAQPVLSEEARTRALIFGWAKNAVETAKLVKKPKGKKANDYLYAKAVEAKARNLIMRIVLPGEMYLIRGTGTRKGTGTFYTKPQLAIPTVHRTLEPLVYDIEGDGPDRKLTPKGPEDILKVTVCDPAMGSGSFLVAALRYITDALYDSLWSYEKIKERVEGGTIITLPSGAVAEGTIPEDLVRCRPGEESFERMTKARLKRYVVERCIYGVDINSLAVELSKLSLWVETMDPDLPFEFLDHKLKVGNSLVGCWFDNFQEYPVMAWMREGGDKDHKGVHYEKGAWTKKIKEILKDVVKSELVSIITGQQSIEADRFGTEDNVKHLHEKAVELFKQLHAMPLYGDGYQNREEFYRTKIRGNEEFVKLKEAFDLWCSVWFWPGDWLDEDAPTPTNFYAPTEIMIRRVSEITEELKFFHWEVEFPEIFVGGKGGFDGMIGNPPWEISKPKSQEFFSIHDPIFRTYGKQDALAHQNQLFQNNWWVERQWVKYCSYFKALSNWCKNVGFPYGDPTFENNGGNKISLIRGKSNHEIHRIWRNKRKSHLRYTSSSHPFLYQGSADLNTYKMFLEITYHLCTKSGRFGIIVPSGIYTDNGTESLRSLFINQCKLGCRSTARLQ